MSGTLPLSGGVNFRDIGGLPTTNGTIRYQTIYRSGRLNRLTMEDRTVVETLGIRLICDFRSTLEQTAEPNHWIPDTARIADWGTSASGDVTALRDKLRPDSTASEGRAIMLDLYGKLAERHADRYAVAFKSIAAGEVPAILACAAGKDRTGVGIALLLDLVGTTREAIVDNYALSEKVYDFPKHFYAEAARAEARGETGSVVSALVRQSSPEALKAILASDPDYVVRAFDAVETRYGSVRGYAIQRLGLSDAEISRVERNLVA